MTQLFSLSPAQENLEQKILQVLSEAGSPVKIAQLVKKYHVPKKTLNKILYHLKEEGKVSLEGPATWCLGGDAPGDEVPAVPKDLTAHPSLGNLSFRATADSFQELSWQWASPGSGLASNLSSAVLSWSLDCFLPKELM